MAPESDSIDESRPENENQRDVILRFLDDYRIALEQARISANHTATEGWQRLYQGHYEKQRKKRREMAGRLRLLATALEDFGLDEDQEKELRDIRTASAELRSLEEVFQAQTVEPVRAPVAECDRLIRQAIADAQREEAAAPLHNPGLEHLMRDTIAHLEKPTWSSDRGLVELIQ